MKIDSEQAANDFLELASEQRLNILFYLSEKKLNISRLSELLKATKPEIHRNVGRLVKTGLIVKDSDANYSLTTYGNVVLVQISSFSFISKNAKYFQTHTLKHLEEKFIQRIGALQDCTHTKGFVKVLEKWKKIHENANEYIFNILSEVPYSEDIIDVISSKLKDKIQVRSIFSESAIIPEARKEIFSKRGFQKFITDGTLQRRIKSKVPITVLVTDKEGAVCFPNLDGEPDMSEMFSSSNPNFREWCQDYFYWNWKHSSAFQESKLKE